MIEAGQGQISCILGQGLMRRTWLGNFRNAMPRGPAKDDQIAERIRTKAIRAMNRNTRSFTERKQAGQDCVRIPAPPRHHLTMHFGCADDSGTARGGEKVVMYV